MAVVLSPGLTILGSANIFGHDDFNMHGDNLHCIADVNSIVTDRFLTEDGIDYICATLLLGESYQHSKYELVHIISFCEKLESDGRSA